MSTYFLTGAGSGIGAAVAARLLDRGDDVVVLARDMERAQQLETQLAGARAVVADLADPARLHPTLAEQELPGRVDALLHIAGVAALGAVADMPIAEWERQLTINLLAPAELTRVLLPAVRAARGQVLFVNSGAGLRTSPEWAAYAASKHGLKALADGLRQEEAGNGVRVTSVYPGRTATPMQESIYAYEGREYDTADLIDPGSVATSILAALDLPRDAQIVDVMIRPGV